MPRDYKTFEEWWRLDGQYEYEQTSYDNAKSIWMEAHKVGYDAGFAEAKSQAEHGLLFSK